MFGFCIGMHLFVFFLSNFANILIILTRNRELVDLL